MAVTKETSYEPQCPICGRQFETGARFCSNCGAQRGADLENSHRSAPNPLNIFDGNHRIASDPVPIVECPYCHELLPAQVTVCSHCGQERPSSQVATYGYRVTTPEGVIIDFSSMILLEAAIKDGRISEHSVVHDSVSDKTVCAKDILVFLASATPVASVQPATENILGDANTSLIEHHQSPPKHSKRSRLLPFIIMALLSVAALFITYKINNSDDEKQKQVSRATNLLPQEKPAVLNYSQTEYLIVPNIINTNTVTAKQILHSAGFKFAISKKNPEAASLTVPVGQVLKQYPNPASKYKRGGVVYVTLSKGTPAPSISQSPPDDLTPPLFSQSPGLYQPPPPSRPGEDPFSPFVPRTKKPCSQCYGAGKIRHTECEGTGRCKHCGGTGTSGDSCLSCRNNPGYEPCSDCNGTGFKRALGLSCSTCRGRGVVRCFSCKGTGKQKCFSCFGTGRCQGIPFCENGYIRCDRCFGSGEER